MRHLHVKSAIAISLIMVLCAGCDQDSTINHGAVIWGKNWTIANVDAAYDPGLSGSGYGPVEISGFVGPVEKWFYWKDNDKGYYFRLEAGDLIIEVDEPMGVLDQVWKDYRYDPVLLYPAKNGGYVPTPEIDFHARFKVTHKGNVEIGDGFFEAWAIRPGERGVSGPEFCYEILALPIGKGINVTYKIIAKGCAGTLKDGVIIFLP